MGQDRTLSAKDGFTLSAYEAKPAGKPRGGIVVIQEIFGVNSHIRRVTYSFAAAGYLAIAPALFDRAEAGVQLSYGQDDMQAGIALRGKVSADAADADVAAAIEAAAEAGKVGVVGYCWGGSLAFVASAKLPVAAAVGYYGGQIAKQLDLKPKAPLILHFGEHDHGIPLSDVDAIKAALPEVPVYVYPGAGHGFNCDERGSFDAEAAKLARQRTDAFFAEHVG